MDADRWIDTFAIERTFGLVLASCMPEDRQMLKVSRVPAASLVACLFCGVVSAQNVDSGILASRQWFMQADPVKVSSLMPGKVTSGPVEFPCTVGGNLLAAASPTMSLSGRFRVTEDQDGVRDRENMTISASTVPDHGTNALDTVQSEAFAPDSSVEDDRFSRDDSHVVSGFKVGPGVVLTGNCKVDAGFKSSARKGATAPTMPKAIATPIDGRGDRMVRRPMSAVGDTERYWFTVGKGQWHRQFDATTVLPASAKDGAWPFEFWANAGGNLMTATPRVDGPIMNPEPYNNNGFLGLSPVGFWRYGWPNFDDWTTETLSELNSLFGNGTYIFTGAGEVVGVSLAGDIYPIEAPRMTVFGGNWIEPGVCMVPPGGFTIATSPHPEWEETGVDQEILLIVYGDGVVLEELAVASDGRTDPTLSIDVPAGLLSPGSECTVLAKFHNMSTSVGTPGDWYAIASYAMATEFTIRVRVPADLNGDGHVTSADLAILLGAWGPCVGCSADLDGDGQVASSDLAVLLGAWG